MVTTRSLKSRENHPPANTKSKSIPLKRKTSTQKATPKTPQLEPYVEVTTKRKPSEQELARKRLLSSAFPTTLPCREREMEEIHLHLRNALLQRAGCCLYISGVPGTGKTATVHQVIKRLQLESESSNTLDPFRYIEINGLKLTDPKQVYVSLWRAIHGSTHMKISSQRALDHLESYFSPNSSTSPPRMMNIVIMDELDILINRSQSVIYNFFEWPNRIGSNLIVIAIANTMDLPERLLSNKVSSRLGLRRVNFQPYNHAQLVQIIQSRLADLSGGIFEKDAIELCSRKVSAVSGDARKALSICHRATELIDQLSLQSKSKAVTAKVTMELIHTAIKEMYLSSGATILQHCSFHQKLFIAALIKCMKRDNAAEIRLKEILDFHGQLCRVHQQHHSSIAIPTLSDMLAIVLHLSTSKCILLEGGKAELYSRVRLYLNEDEAVRVLSSSDPLFKKILSGQTQ
jgi:Cdc6-like AAA superfamily ATPase